MWRSKRVCSLLVVLLDALLFQEDLGPNLSPEASNSDADILWFSSILPGKSWDNKSKYLINSSFNNLPIHYPQSSSHLTHAVEKAKN
jgi:hypothetical protein